MEKQKQLPKSRWLFLTLLSLLMTLGGATSAWATDPVTETFTSGTNGWAYSSSLTVGTGWGYNSSYAVNSYYTLSSTHRNGSSGTGLCCTEIQSAYYIITPLIEANSSITFYGKKTGSNTGYIVFYKATKDGETYTVDTSSSLLNWNSSTGDLSTTMVQNTFNIGAADTYVAIRLSRAAIDDFEYTPYIETCAKPNNLQYSDVTDESATITWDAGEADKWNFRYKAAGDADFTLVEGLTSATYAMTGLDAATTYTVEVQTVCSAVDQSKWVSVEFTTLLCDPSAQKNITLTMWDTYGDGWNGNAAIQIVDEATSIEVGRFTVTNAAAKNEEVIETQALCPNRNYIINWISGSYDSECRFTIKDVDGATIVDKSSSTPTAGQFIKYSWSNAEGAKFTINTDGTTQDLGVAAIDGTLAKTFTITNSGNEDLVISVAKSGDAYAQKTLLFSNDKGWSNVYLYAWNDGGALTSAFPGNQQQATGGTNEYSQPLYSLIVPKDATKIIVSNGNSGDGNQSQDITMDFDKYGLYLDGSYAGIFYGDGDLIVKAKKDDIDGSAKFTVALSTATAGIKNGNVELTFTAVNGGSPFTIPVTGAVLPAGAQTIDFNDNQLPDGWSKGSWNFTSGYAYCQSSTEMVTKKLDFTGHNFIALKVKANDSGSGDWLKVYGSSDNGENYSQIKEVTYNNSDFGSSSADWTTIVVDNIPSTVNKLKFQGYWVRIDEIAGLKYDANDPAMGIYTNTDWAEGHKVTTASVKKDFGFATTEAPEAATYYIKNVGTGTMTLAKGADPAGLTVTLDKTSVAASEYATLTIAMPIAENAGYHGGDVVVTATDLGTFTVSAQGVVIDENKMDLDFASKDIPAAWTKNNWSRNATNGYIETSGYSSTSLETINLTAAANEDLVIVAQQTSSSSSYKFGVNYKKVGVDDEWQELIPAANIGTTWTTLHAQLTEAGDYQLQFNGACTQVKRIYGLAEVNEPFMQVYDGENLAGASYAFTKVNDENPVNHEFTVKNVGKAKLTNLTATLSGTNAEDYAVAISGATGAGNNEIEADAQATVTVTQKAVIGTHSATLTIAADGFEKVIALSGETTDHTALNIDFSTAGVWPAEILEHEGWNVNWGTANQPATTAASMILTPLTVANASDVFSFKVKYYSSSQSSKRDLVINYTTDGGLTWNPYNWGTELEPVTSLKSQITSSLNNFEITNIPAGTVAFDFSGTYISVDDITGDMKVATAPLMTLNTVSDGISGANLKADGQAVYTLANKGNADYATTVTLDGVSAAISGEGVTYDGTNLTIPAGKTADITVTMTFEAPYGVKNGSVQLAKAGWVDAIALNYTATLVDPTDFVEDFSGNAKPAGWYSDGWTYTSGAASVVAGVEKPMITEKIGAVDGKNELKFNAWTTSDDPQTLKVYTSTDRKNWTQLGEDITLTKEEDALYSRTLTNGDQYIKFGGVIAKVDNITGVKKLDAPAHDLYEVTNDMVATSKVPGSSITVHVTGVSLRATEDDIIAELWVKKDDAGTMLDQQTGLEMTVNVNKEFTLTGNVPAVEGAYKMWVTVKKASDGSIHFNTDEVDLTIAHTKTMNITTFENAAGVQADDYNQYDGTFFVTVQNTGSTAIAANEVSVTLTDASDAENKFISIWTAENSDVLYMNTKKDATDIATDCTLKVWCWNTTEDGIWVAFSNINEGFWSLDLSGKTNFIICRVNPAGTDPDPWNNVWNKSGDLTLSDGNLVKFNGYSGDDLTFTAESMTELAPTMTTTLKVDVYGTLTAGDDASISFTAKEGVTSTYYAGGLTRSINVTAAPVIVIKESDGSITPAITGEFQNRKVEMQRYFNAKWNTICVPFAIADVEAAFGEGAKAFEFTGYTGGELQFHNVTALGTATPYILYLPNAIGVATTLAGLTVSDAAAGSETSGGATFQGTYAPIAAPGMDGLWGVTSAGKIAKGSNTASLKGFRAYFTGGDLAGAHIAIFDDATGITTVLDAKDVLNDGKVYNLNGQRVENAHKGIFIVNGKKVVVK